MSHARHRVATDIILEDDGKVLLVKRADPPFEGMWAIPGGHLEDGEQLVDAAKREAREETNLDITIDWLVGVYDTPGRDPRGPVISVSYACSRIGGDLDAGTDAADARWFPLENLPELGFDHADILADYREQRDRK